MRRKELSRADLYVCDLWMLVQAGDPYQQQIEKCVELISR